MLTCAPLKVAVLCSRRAPGLIDLLERDRGRSYEIVCCVASEPTFAERVELEARGVPVRVHSIRDFCAARGTSVFRDMRARAEYDAATAELLAPYDTDLVLLDGYVYLVTAPLLQAYAARIVNLHFSDLTLRLPDGRPRFPGIRAVRDALTAGESETRATIHLVNAEADAGAPIVRSWPVPVSPMVGEARAWNATDMLKAYAFAHQEWMLRGVAGPLLAAALRLIATRAVDLTDLASKPPAAVVPWEADQRGGIRAAHSHAA